MTNQDTTTEDLWSLFVSALTALHLPSKAVPEAKVSDWSIQNHETHSLIVPPQWCRYSRLLRLIKQMNLSAPDLVFNIEKDPNAKRYCIVLHRTVSELTKSKWN